MFLLLIDWVPPFYIIAPTFYFVVLDLNDDVDDVDFSTSLPSIILFFPDQDTFDLSFTLIKDSIAQESDQMFLIGIAPFPKLQGYTTSYFLQGTILDNDSELTFCV